MASSVSLAAVGCMTGMWDGGSAVVLVVCCCVVAGGLKCGSAAVMSVATAVEGLSLLVSDVRFERVADMAEW